MNVGGYEVVILKEKIFGEVMPDFCQGLMVQLEILREHFGGYFQLASLQRIQKGNTHSNAKLSCEQVKRFLFVEQLLVILMKFLQVLGHHFLLLLILQYEKKTLAVFQLLGVSKLEKTYLLIRKLRLINHAEEIA